MIIRAPSRIHMSLIDLNGSYRRVDGGIGLALADPQFVLEIEQIESGRTRHHRIWVYIRSCFAYL